MATPLPERRLVAQARAAFADLAGGGRVLAAVSGGSDSTALLHLLTRALAGSALTLAVVHLDHGLHPGSAAAADFVARLAARLGLACRIGRADVAGLARSRRLGIEEAGRMARHELFRQAAAEEGARAVALAHTRDDRGETLLLNLTRGAGSGGLGAMRETAFGIFRRPLLTASRAELREFLCGIGEAWIEDPTNRDLRFARNRIRLEVLPALQSINPRAGDALARAAALLAAEDDWLEAEAARRLAVADRLPVAALGQLPEALARRVALAWLGRAAGSARNLGHAHVDAVLGLARGQRQGLATDLPGGGRVTREDGALVVVLPAASPAPFCRRLALAGETPLPEVGLVLRAGAGDDGALPAGGLRVRLRAAALAGSVVRSPGAKDRFQPLGAPGARRLSHYLIDRKVPRRRRPLTPVVAGIEGILWVVGHQVAEAARVRPGDAAIVIEAAEA